MLARIAFFIYVAISAASPVAAAEPAPPDSFLHQYAATFRFRLGRPTSIQVSPTGDAVYYLRSGPRDFVQNLYRFDTGTNIESQLLTANDLLLGTHENLSVAERARRERMRLAARGIAGYELSRDGGRMLVPLSGRLFVFDVGAGSARELKSGAGAIDPHLSFNARHVAFTRDGDLWVVDIATDKARRLTKHETAAVSWGDAEFVAQEEMSRFSGFWWSPDGKTIACQRTDVSNVETFHIADPAHPETPPQSWAYPRPGKANADVRLFLIPVSGKKPVEVTWDRAAYPYLARVVWENGPLTVLVQNRGQSHEALVAIDEKTAKTRILLDERDDAWLNIDETMPVWLADGSGFLWTSERCGAPCLEIHSADGKLEQQLTSPGRYRRFVHLDPVRRWVWFEGGQTGKEGDWKPTRTNVYRVSFGRGNSPGNVQPVTDDPGLNGAVFSSGHDVWVHTFEGLKGERRQTVTRVGSEHEPDGTEIGELPSRAETPSWRPRLEFTTADDSLQFHAVIIRPRNFNPGLRYPVLLDVYGGPGVQVVQESSYKYLLDQWFADQGFVVITLDGRGTPNRGRAWERAMRGSFADVPLEDQAAGVKALGKRYPEMDMDRVGIYGWSYGGYMSALAVMRRPDVFKAGVAGAPVSNWLDYDTHYTERYIGLPDAHPEAYEESSVLTSAPNLSRPLLIIHGTDDDNVYFTHSIQLANALYRAGKPFEFLPLSGFTHMVTDPVVTEMLETRIADFMKRELGSPEKPKAQSMKHSKKG